MTIKIPKRALYAAGALVAATVVAAVVVVTGGGSSDEPECVSENTGKPTSCEQTPVAVSPEEYETLSELPSPEELTEAAGEIAGTCIVDTGLADVDPAAASEAHDNLELLIETAEKDPDAPTADKNYTVSDALYDLVGQVKGCDPGLEAQLDNALEDLP